MKGIFCHYKYAALSRLKKLFFLLHSQKALERIIKHTSCTKPLVLLYHNIQPGCADFSLSPEAFEKQILFLKKMKYEFIFESEWEKSKKNRTVIISVDDGYINNYTYMFPLLKKYDVKASVNLRTDIFLSNDGSWLTIEQIKEMQDSGLVEFDAHTCNHPHLPQCTTEELYHEIVDCKEQIAEITSIMPNVFVYPYGRFDKRVLEIVRENYEICFSIWITDEDFEEQYCIKRKEVFEKDDEKKIAEYCCRAIWGEY